jgi:hypothetical protein
LPFFGAADARSRRRADPTPKAGTTPVRPPERAGDAVEDDYDPAADGIGSYEVAIAELRRRHYRAVVADDGREIRLTVYAGAEVRASLELEPLPATIASATAAISWHGKADLAPKGLRHLMRP